jgi:peptide/nickel transport system substrate-binding protein
LAEAGYPDGLTIKIIPPPSTLFKDIAVAIQDQLAKVGIKVEVELVEQARFQEYDRKGFQNGLTIGVMVAGSNWV